MKSKEQKRIEAIERQEYYNNLSKEEKIKLIESLRRESKKELARLNKK